MEYAGGPLKPALLRGTVRQSARRAFDSEFLTRTIIPFGIALATFGAASPWLHAFRVQGQAELLVAASVLPVAVTAVVAGGLRRSPAASYGVSAGLLAVVLIATAGLHVGTLISDLGKVPDRLLSETLPLSGSPVLLSPAILITWLCGAITAEMVYRSSPRATVGDAGLAVPVVFFVLSYAVTAGAPSRDRLAGALVLVGSATVAVMRQDQRSAWTVVSTSAADSLAARSLADSRAVPVRRRTILARSVVATVALAVLLTAVLPSVGGLSGKPVTINRPAPVSSALIVDPVGSTAALRDGDPKARPFPVVEIVTNRRAPGYFASAVLDNFDGSQWTFDATFEPTGGRVPAQGSVVRLVGAEDLKATETIESSLPDGLLPVADRAVSLSGSPVAVDAQTGMVLPARQGSGKVFRVESRIPAASLAAIPTVDGIGGSGGPSNAVVADVTIPADSSTAMAAAVRFVSSLSGTRPTPTVGFLQQLLSALRTQERHLTPYAPPAAGPAGNSSGQSGGIGATAPAVGSGGSVGHLGGTSLSEVINAVTVNRSATPEQFATFFALIARYLGVPARLVTGFRLGGSSSGAAMAAGTHVADNRQAWTWVEVPVSGMGWVVADPTPDAVTGVAAPPPEQAQAAPTTLPASKANAVPRTSTSGGHAVAKPARIPRSHPNGLPAWSLALIAIGGLLVLMSAWPAVSLVRRRLRSRARRSSDPAMLAAGAWLELLDGLDRAGMQVGASSTGSEVATEASGHFGAGVGPQVVEIATVADRGLYSVLDPPSVGESQGAWQNQLELTEEILRSLDRRQRARALVAVGSGPKRPAE